MDAECLAIPSMSSPFPRRACDSSLDLWPLSLCSRDLKNGSSGNRVGDSGSFLKVRGGTWLRSLRRWPERVGREYLRPTGKQRNSGSSLGTCALHAAAHLDSPSGVFTLLWLSAELGNRTHPWSCNRRGKAKEQEGCSSGDDCWHKAGAGLLVERTEAAHGVRRQAKGALGHLRGVLGCHP